MIISTNNSPLYKIACYLYKIIIKSIPESFSHIKNSYELIKKLERTTLENNYIDIVGRNVFIHKRTNRSCNR